MTQEERITKLMDMLDHSEAYSEQDIRDFIGSDAEVQEMYRTIIETRQSFRKAKADNQSIGTDEAWQRFEQEHLKADKTRAIRLYPRARQVAAAVAAVLLLSGLSYAAIVHIRYRSDARQVQTAMQDTTKQQPVAIHITSIDEKPDTVQTGPKTFDNVLLGEMLPEIAAHYGMTVCFQNEDKKTLRLFFTWNPAESIDKAIMKLNQFKSLSVKRNGETITVE